MPIAVAYGCDVAPDQTVWWSQLFGHRIGRVDPATGTVTAWRPPFDGPRRLEVGPDNVVWVPGYGSGELGGFDPTTETWKVYDLPTQPLGQELPYNVGANKTNGEVWITGSNSNTPHPLPAGHRGVHRLPAADGGRLHARDRVRRRRRGVDVHLRSGDRRRTLRAPAASSSSRSAARAAPAATASLQLGEECDDGNTGRLRRLLGALHGGDRLRRRRALRRRGVRRRQRRTTATAARPPCRLEPGFDMRRRHRQRRLRRGVRSAGARSARRSAGGAGVRRRRDERRRGSATTATNSDCDGCSATARSRPAAATALRCGGEECDDGNALDCDGCSAACAVEDGAECGDGTVNAECGEECDPPGEDCSVICTEGDGVLGTRRMTLGGPFYSSALGTAVPLGESARERSISSGGRHRRARASPRSPSTGPVFYSAGILGGQFGTLCVRIDSCAGFVDCDGGSAVGTLMVQDSNGPGLERLADQRHDRARRGRRSRRRAARLPTEHRSARRRPRQPTAPPPPIRPPAASSTPPAARRRSTSTAFRRSAPAPSNRAARRSTVPRWEVTDGPGKLAATFLFEEDPQAGDTANVVVLDD